jgi:hypothetical protein
MARVSIFSEITQGQYLLALATGFITRVYELLYLILMICEILVVAFVALSALFAVALII